MLRNRKQEKRRLAAFILFLLLAVCTPLRPFRVFHSPGALLYMGLVLAWALTVRRRILNGRIRRLLLCCCAFMLLIFVLRICRYDFFREFTGVSEYLLYLYGVCYTMAALLSFLTALYTGRGERPVKPALLAALWASAAALCALMLTNPLHGLFYEFEPGSLDIRVHGPVYILMIGWCAVFAIAAIALLLIRCRNSFSRGYWFLPALGFAAGAGLLTWYFLAGGAPQLRGVKLFNLQEAFCITVILPFEAIFRIGLIPTNSDYELFFRSSAIKAAILDGEGRTVMASPSYLPEPGEGERVRRWEIPGGSVVWFEDVGELMRLRRELTAVNEELAAENELIREEKELQEEQISYETRNRLYDSISETLRPQSEAMRKLLEEENSDPADFRRRLERVLVMGAYMKRMGNLMLLGDGKTSLPIGELALSVAESFEYLELAGVACSLDCRGSCEAPKAQLLAAYRLFQRLLEANWDRLHACRLELMPEEGVLMRLAMDSPELRGAEGAPALGLALETRLEDETWLAVLRAPAGTLPGREAEA